MAKYIVDVCRISYCNRDIEVEAKTSKEAEKKALESIGNHDFSIEHTAEYEVQSCKKIL